MGSPRVFISTDIGGSDKDDDQSLVHALLYADKLNIVGIGSTDEIGRKGDILQVINTYAKDYKTLSTHGDYPTPEYLKSITYQGATDLAPGAGFTRSTEASRAIIAAARKGSAEDPLYVLTWGGETDIAQALHDAPDIANKIRLLTVDKQDPNATRYLEKEWKNDVWWIQDMGTFRGMYVPASGANKPFDGWSSANAKDHGALGNYFYQHTLNLYENTGYNKVINGVKMGDTPTILYLLGANNLDDPTAGGWGGDFIKAGTNYWTDSKAASDKMGSYYGAKTVAEHRSEIFADFAERLDRLKGPKEGNSSTPGNDGDDNFAAKAGAQSYQGGAGSDTVDYSNSNTKVWVNLETGNAQNGHAQGDKFMSIENLVGSRHDDILTGNSANNRLEGGAGNDKLQGGAGQDILSGGTGDDRLTGGKDGDMLVGGDGNDVFVFTNSQDSLASDRDVIADFKSGQDKIDLSQIDARAGTTANDAFSFIGTDTFHNSPGELRFSTQANGVLVEAEINGDGQADFSIFLAGIGSVSASDFIF